MPGITHRFENSMRNGMHNWAPSQPAFIRALLFLPCLIEYLIVCAVSAIAIIAVVFLMTFLAIFRLDPDNRPSLR